MKQPCIYILASGKCGTLYIGVTSDLLARLYQHREGITRGFTSRYGVVHLVWYEMATRWKARSFAKNSSRNGIATGGLT